ncbi:MULTISPECIES: AraC family transcriptional regulator [Acinetobacter]|uniref:AraC family transcriptional regulator n=1 Tax=Acinetobacter TaxID=469 RepID=UPI00029C94F5|nr:MULTISPECIES: AraC family transcriptional regulator [Acinetobacter]EKU39129.1 transcription regulator AraC N-terminal arabinose-binding domain protein [Acinetobacter sp. WC-141]MBM7139910.1 AraC family transcriptional regulator ligand-binding domain-containing protein [Acinetobacter sp. 105-3]
MNPELPGTYINLLVETVKRWGVSGEQLLDGSGITSDQLKKPYWYVEFNHLNQFIERAITLCEEPALAGYLALEMTASCYGSVGMAAMVSPNLGEALKILEQFIGSRCNLFKPQLKQEKNYVCWSIHQPVKAFQLSPNANIFLLIGFVQIAKKLTGLSHLGKVELQMPEPIGFAQISDQLAVTCLFNQKRNSWTFPKEYLVQPVLTADPMLAPLLDAQCKRDIEKLKLKSGWKGRVKQVAEKLLLDEQGETLKVGQVAQIMNMSERTLQRYLALENTSFTVLIDLLKKEHAQKLLAQNNMSIEKVALMLGYAETSHFTRAFKRWMGMTPKYFQTQHKMAGLN